MPAIGSDEFKIFVIESYDAIFGFSDAGLAGWGYENGKPFTLQGFLSKVNSQLILNLGIELSKGEKQSAFATCGLVEFSEKTEMIKSKKNESYEEIKRTIISFKLLNYGHYETRLKELFSEMPEDEKKRLEEGGGYRGSFGLLEQLSHIHRVIEKNAGDPNMFYESNLFIKR